MGPGSPVAPFEDVPFWDPAPITAVFWENRWVGINKNVAIPINR